MSLKSLFAAVLIVAAGASPVALAAPAEAQATRTVVTERTTVRTNRPVYRPGNRYGQRRYVTRRVCTNRVRYGRTIRTCRTVRRYR